VLARRGRPYIAEAEGAGGLQIYHKLKSVSGARQAFSPDFVALAVTNDAAAVASSAKRLRRLG